MGIVLQLSEEELELVNTAVSFRFKEMAEHFFKEQRFRTTYHSRKLSLWEKHGFRRLYIPRSAYEQAGWIDLNTGEVYAFRPGSASIMESAVEYIIKGGDKE